MQEEQKYESRKGGPPQTAAQRLTEELCINIAANNNQELSDKFWLLPKWRGVFAKQMQAIIPLLQIYTFSALLKALNDRRCKRITSFRAPWYTDVVEEYEEKIKQESVDINKIKFKEKLDTTQKPRPKQNKGTSLRSKLQ